MGAGGRLAAARSEFKGLTGSPKRTRAAYLFIAGARDGVNEQALHLILIAGIVAKFCQGADPQLNDLILDALLKVELNRQGRECVLWGGELLIGTAAKRSKMNDTERSTKESLSEGCKCMKLKRQNITVLN